MALSKISRIGDCMRCYQDNDILQNIGEYLNNSNVLGGGLFQFFGIGFVSTIQIITAFLDPSVDVCYQILSVRDPKMKIVSEGLMHKNSKACVAKVTSCQSNIYAPFRWCLLINGSSDLIKKQLTPRFLT